jgi:Domain of unknown function (DUF4340)
MKVRGLLVAALVLAALLGVLYWSNHHGSTADNTVKASPEAAPKILSFNQDDVTSLTIHRKDGPTLDLSRNSSGVWQIASPEILAADQDAVSGVLSAFSSLNAERLLEDKASHLASYGLEAPALEIDAILKNNKTQRLLIGDQTPSGNSSYAMLAGDPRLFTIAGFNKSSLDKTAGDLRDKRLLTTDFDKVSQMELLVKKPDKKLDITFARDQEAWQILRPGPFRADTGRVEDLVRSLKEAKMQLGSASDDSNNAAAFQSAVPFAVAKISGASGIQELEVRKVKDDYYAKSTVASGVYKVPASVGTSLDKTLDDFRNKKLFDFGYDEPNKIEIHDGSKAYFLTRSGSDWWGPDGKKRDPSSVEVLLGHLRDLAATKFPDSGFTTPALELIVTSLDSKRVERVSVAKQESGYIAKREGEPALYELASSAIQQLQESAAANVKPAASSPTK